jgi:plasmid stabilization system protein ParE
MNIRKSDAFLADVERQFEWYARNASWEVAERYLAAIESTSRLLRQYPELGPAIRFNHPRIQAWRFFVLAKPFKKHVIFYEAEEAGLILRRVMHGHRDLPRRLLGKG